MAKWQVYSSRNGNLYSSTYASGSYLQEDDMKQFKNVAHEIGLNNQQVNAIVDYQIKAIDNQISNESSKIIVQMQD